MRFDCKCLKRHINAKINKLSIDPFMYWLFRDLSSDTDQEHPWLLTFLFFSDVSLVYFKTLAFAYCGMSQ